MDGNDYRDDGDDANNDDDNDDQHVHHHFDGQLKTPTIMMVMVMPITMAMMMFSESKRAVGMMHGPSVPPQDPTLPPTMANSPFYMTDGSGDGDDDDGGGDNDEEEDEEYLVAEEYSTLSPQYIAMVNNPFMSKTATLVIKIIMRKEMFRMTKMVVARF